jgi:hypothetical protein
MVILCCSGVIVFSGSHSSLRKPVQNTRRTRRLCRTLVRGGVHVFRMSIPHSETDPLCSSNIFSFAPKADGLVNYSLFCFLGAGFPFRLSVLAAEVVGG